MVCMFKGCMVWSSQAQVALLVEGHLLPPQQKPELTLLLEAEHLSKCYALFLKEEA